MSKPSIPPNHNEYNLLDVYDENLTIREVFGVVRVGEPLTPILPPTKKSKRRRPPRKSGLYVVLQSAQQHGFTHPKEGYFVMLPKEFDAILAQTQHLNHEPQTAWNSLSHNGL
jgi:hypothetical protein